VSVAHLDAEAMAFFASRPNDAPSVIADAKIREYAERQGGRTLAYWRLCLGRIWGDPIMMTSDEVAKRLGWSVAEADEINDQTMRACGWR
jgi:hypothetical protein